MRHISTFGKNKRGNQYNRRPTKSADGFSATFADQRIISNPKHPKYNHEKEMERLSLALYGTCDVLNRWRGRHFQYITKEHPTDKGYFKRTQQLTTAGKNRLLELSKKYYLIPEISSLVKITDKTSPYFNYIGKVVKIVSDADSPIGVLFIGNEYPRYYQPKHIKLL